MASGALDAPIRHPADKREDVRGVRVRVAPAKVKAKTSEKVLIFL